MDGVVMAVAVAAWLGGPRPAHGQTAASPSTAPKPAAAPPAGKPTTGRPTTGKPSAPAAVAVKRTPDGQPDMRGLWFKAGGGINEANQPKVSYTDDCRAFFGTKAEPTGFNNTEPRAKPQHQPDPPRPQGIVDPADRILPWRPEAAAARLDHVQKMGPPPATLAHIEMTARCAPPGPWQDRITQILQRPGAVVILHENDHASRTIHLDGRPHPGPAVKTFMGDSIGHWEGATLVVDTTNLNGHGAFGRLIPYYSDAMHIVERYIVMAPDRIDYEIVYDDPKMFTRPFKSVGYFFPADDGYEIHEETCVEGSYTLKNIFGF